MVELDELWKCKLQNGKINVVSQHTGCYVHKLNPKTRFVIYECKEEPRSIFASGFFDLCLLTMIF